MSKAYFIGADIGTQGARVALLDEKGRQVVAFDQVFQLTENSREEQSPQEWWDATARLIQSVTESVKSSINLSDVKAIAVTSTSGTIIPVDKSGDPLYKAIMYSDTRSVLEAKMCKDEAEKNITRGYKAFNSSSGLPKMVWYVQNFGIDRLHKFIHASDFIAGKLCENFTTTDYTNVLKSGYDVHNLKWPEYISNLGIRHEWLQEVKPSGTPIAPLKPELAQAWGLPDNVLVTTGMTDGCVSQVAAGAVSPGQWNTTIGTTLVIKGVTKTEIEDPSGALYNHRHPEGYWMPGGASNTGADWISRLFAKEELPILNAQAALLSPTGVVAWPLLQKGERFPFFSPQAEGFWPQGLTKEVLYTASMEGVAYIERYAYERIRELSGENVQQVFAAGGGSSSDTWLTIRSTVLNLPVCKMKNTSGAAGAAILAASQTYYKSLSQAAKEMVKPEKSIEPQRELTEEYNQGYDVFISELKKRNYIE